LRRNNPKAANEHLLQALKSNPQHLPAIMLQAIVSLGLGNYETTRKNAEHLLSHNPKDTVATRLLAAARLGLGQPREALEGLQGLLKAEDTYAHVLAAKAYMMLKDYAAATRHLELASSRMPENPELTTQLAAGHLKSGDMEQVWSLLQRLPVEDSEVRRLWHQLAEAQLQRGQAERALHTLASLEKRHQAEPLTWNLRGMAHMALNAQAQAIKSFEQALALDPNYLPAVFNLAQIDLRAGRADQARRRYEAVLQRVPNNAEALLAAAHFALRAGDEQGYLSLLRRSVQADPRSPEGWRQLVAFYLSKSKANDALSVAQDGLSKNPEDPSFRELLGRAQLAAGQKDNALATFRKLVVDHPRHAPSRALQAQAYLALGDTQRARQSFQEALDLDRDFHDALIGLVQLEVREQRFDRARALVEDFKRRHPELPGVHGLEGDVHRAMGDHRAALAAYERAHRLMPSGALLVQVGDALTLLGQRQEAIARLEQWLAKHPEDQLVRHKLGGYLTESGRLDKAVLHYETLIRQNPNNPMLLNNLAWLYGQLGDPRALETAQQAHRLAPNEPLILDTYGWILLKQGRTAEALGHLRTAARQLPRHPSVQFHYAEVLARTGDKAGARSALEAALRLGLSGAERSEAEALRRQL
ncbi:MAG: PEP-CTERM system TPR-repeat protein PrsT, partial [Burkholderiales bacterium]|nr:PEP-CTERM system TPR-repeat protein PrsT [Burkholderiales bacterium]